MLVTLTLRHPTTATTRHRLSLPPIIVAVFVVEAAESRGKHKRDSDGSEEKGPSPSDTKRKHILEDSNAATAPSGYSKKAHTFDESLFIFHRPPRIDTIPLTLIDPIFAEFTDNVQSCTPTAEDFALVEDLTREMPRRWESERDQCCKFRQILRKHYLGVRLEAAEIGLTRYISNGHYQFNGPLLVVCEGKTWDGNGDPAIQAAGYVLAGLCQTLLATDWVKIQDPFPCVIIYIVGMYSLFFIPTGVHLPLA